MATVLPTPDRELRSRGLDRGKRFGWTSFLLASLSVVCGSLLTLRSATGVLFVFSAGLAVLAVIASFSVLGIGKRARTSARVLACLGLVLGLCGFVISAPGVIRDIFPTDNGNAALFSGADESNLGVDLRDESAPAPEQASLEEPANSGPITVQEPATSASMAQALGTLSFVLKATRGTDGLWPPVLGTTSAGEIFDPFSPIPDHILATMPAGTELSYSVSDDRTKYSMLLSVIGDDSLDLRFDSTSGLLSESGRAPTNE